MLHRALLQAPRALRRSFGSAATYHVPDSAKLSFREKGYAILPNFLSEAELAGEIDHVYDKFMRGEVAIPGKDFCDMSQTFEAIKGKHPDEWRELLLSPRRASVHALRDARGRRAVAAAAVQLPPCPRARSPPACPFF